MKVSELSGALLDYWTGRAAEGTGFVGRIAEYTDGQTYCVVPAGTCGENGWTGQRIYSPSSDWSIAGPFIERYGMHVWEDEGDWFATAGQGVMKGNTPIVALVRALIRFNYGEAVPNAVPA